MDPSKTTYEVWKLDYRGQWMRVEKEGKVHFDSMSDARKLQQTLFNDGTVIKAAIRESRTVHELNCAGAAVAGRMGLKKGNIQIEGGLKVGPELGSYNRFRKPKST